MSILKTKVYSTIQAVCFECMFTCICERMHSKQAKLIIPGPITENSL